MTPSTDPPACALRRWGLGADDAGALAEAWADPLVAAFTAVPDLDDPAARLARARRWIAEEPARHAAGRAVDRVIIDPGEPERVLGEVGLVARDASRALAEVGYWVAAGARGRGLGSAAVGLLLEQAFAGGSELGAFPPVRTVIARIDPANGASVAVVTRVGFARAGALADGRELWRVDAP